jgi:cytochrome oxidase Cu insertion factor (SCO1/SenC/PrrC family)
VRRSVPLALLAALLLGAGEPPRFEAPAPGSYELPPIHAVRDHELLDEQGQKTQLLGLSAGEAALVSFIFLSCPDACPAATATLARLDAELAERPALGSRVQLVTVSFDPTNDPPERMAALRRSLEPRGRWRFATAPSEAAMTPVLEDFGQDARPSHVLKIFLVDGQGQVRNVYSTGFLDLRILLADLETLLGP